MQLRRILFSLGLVVAVSGSAVLWLRLWQGRQQQDEPAAISRRPAQEQDSSATSLPVLAQVPPFHLKDENGKDFGSADLWGRFTLVDFFFASCSGTCPMQTARMAKLQQQIKDRPYWNNVRLVSITVDPEHDTPEVLRKVASDAGADPQRWKFLSGPRAAIWELAQKGFKLPVEAQGKNPAMPILHTSRVVLVDDMLRVRGYYELLGEDGPAELLKALYHTAEEQFFLPRDAAAPPWLAERQQAQLKTAAGIHAFHDFSFTDRLEESGIRFRNQYVDDATKDHKGNHYDHGNGLVTADVDGDGLPDLYFVSLVGGNRLYRNLGGGRFEDITESAGVAVRGKVSITASFADIDNDGDPDLYVTTVRGGNVLFENDGKGHFRDITAAAGVGTVAHSSGALFFDYDRDGLLDLFLVNTGRYTSNEKRRVRTNDFVGSPPGEDEYYVGLPQSFDGHLFPDRIEQSILFRNTGNNHFVDVSAETGLMHGAFSGDAIPLDVNQDGWPDLYVTNMQGNNAYYENDHGRHFIKRTDEVFRKTPWGAMCAKALDFDNDGRMDMMVVDMHSDMKLDAKELPPDLEAETRKSIPALPEDYLRSGGKSIYGNAFYHRLREGDPKGPFEEISDRIGVEMYWPWGVSVGDLNADGFEDMFVTSSMSFPFRYSPNWLYLNEEGRHFARSEFILGVEPRKGGWAAMPAFECQCESADVKLQACEQLCRRHGGGLVRVWAPLGSRSAVILDLDGDGDLDIVTNDFGSPPMVLMSDLAQRKTDLHYLKVHLTGKTSNRDGLGARVQVRAGGHTYTRVYDGASGYLSHSLYPLYFGLGSAATVDSIEVTWPSGKKQLLRGKIQANRTLEVRES